MNLEKINTQTTWEAASSSINNNNARINEAVVRLENSTYKNKGYFKTLEELNANYPSTGVGSLAYVGTTYPFRIYLWNKDSATWEDSGKTGGDPDVNLSNYYTKAETDSKVSEASKAIDNRIVQETGDSETLVMSQAAVSKEIIKLKANTPISSVGSISLYKGISTSSSTNYPLSEIIPANKVCEVSISIENEAISTGAVFFKNKDGRSLATFANAKNGSKSEYTFSDDVYYLGFSLTDSSIVASGDFIVNINVINRTDKEIEEIKGNITEIKSDIEDIKQSISVSAMSVGSISLYKGISTSSNVKYELSDIVPSNTECEISITIENNAIPLGQVLFKNKDGETIYQASNVKNGHKESYIFSEDIHFISFSLVDSNIVGSGNFIVNLEFRRHVSNEFNELKNDLKSIGTDVDNIKASVVPSISSVGYISLHQGISTSSANNYSLSEIVPANRKCVLNVTIENNVVPSGTIILRDKDKKHIITLSNLNNGDEMALMFERDVHYIAFSFTDSSISGSGDFIVNFKVESGVESLEERVADVENDIERVIDMIDPPTHSVASIPLYIGASTSSSKNYPLSEVIPANKECTINITIENNAVPTAAVFFRNKDGRTLYTAENAKNGYMQIITFSEDVHFVAFSITDKDIAATGNYTVSMFVEGGLDKELNEIKDELAVQRQRIDNLEGSSGSGNGSSFSGATLAKEIINTTRPYYFAQGWSDDDSFGYLDEKLSEIPCGKHFMVFSDIHIDYYANYGLKQKQAIIMKYIHDRLKGCQVLCLGDFLGTLPKEEQAQKQMKWFANEYYTLFGSNFIPALGDHDTDRVNGGLASGEQLSEEFIYNAYFKQAYNYGAVADMAIKVIDGLSLSETKKEAWKYYMKMHYYKDDSINKVRTIIVQQGAVFRNIPDNYNCSGIQLPFIAYAMATAPSDYAIVIASHEYHLNKSDSVINSNYWETKLVALAKAFKNGASYTLSKPQFSVDEETMVWNAVSAEYPSSFDFHGKSGEVFILQGDEHFDYVSYCNGDTMMNVNAVDANPTDSDVLYVLVDRACTIENAGFPHSQFPNIEYTIKTKRRAKAGNFIGTTDEVLFDVMTINEDGLTITRIGDTPEAGIVGIYELFDETKNYEVGDMVTWYEDVPETTSYRPYIYKFINQHSASAWNAADVERVDITESYNRTYKL